MNSGLEDNHSSIEYYDSDYPSSYFGLCSENFDEITKSQGLYFDIPRYLEIAKFCGGPILELCCGTGRVSIPLLMNGHNVTGVDISSSLLQMFRENMNRVKSQISGRVDLVKQDVTALSLNSQHYQLAICAFNSLLCIPDFEDQIKALQSISAHLVEQGTLILDIVNPLLLNTQGDSVPKAFFTRKNVHTGNCYTRFAMTDAFDEHQRQRLHGWYDEITMDGTVKRKIYSLYWRPIFRFEIELMLQYAGFKIKKIEGGHQKEVFSGQSPRMFIHAVKIS